MTEQRQSDEPVAVQPVPEALEHIAGFLLARAARIVHDLNERALSAINLAPRELGLLRIISSAGPLTQQALGQLHHIDRTTIVQLIDGLEGRQLVTRVANVKDRRSNLLFLTPRGKKTLAQAVRLVAKEEERFLAPLDEQEWEMMRKMLIKLINHHLS